MVNRWCTPLELPIYANSRTKEDGFTQYWHRWQTDDAKNCTSQNQTDNLFISMIRQTVAGDLWSHCRCGPGVSGRHMTEGSSCSSPSDSSSTAWRPSISRHRRRTRASWHISEMCRFVHPYLRFKGETWCSKHISQYLCVFQDGCCIYLWDGRPFPIACCYIGRAYS